LLLSVYTKRKKETDALFILRHNKIKKIYVLINVSQLKIVLWQYFKYSKCKRYFFSSVLMWVSVTVGNMPPILATACSVSKLREVSCELHMLAGAAEFLAGEDP
jgi:hypothetical protein